MFTEEELKEAELIERIARLELELASVKSELIECQELRNQLLMEKWNG